MSHGNTADQTLRSITSNFTLCYFSAHQISKSLSCDILGRNKNAGAGLDLRADTLFYNRKHL